MANTIADIAGSSEDFELLTAALAAAGLDDDVGAEDADLTVFAPTDAAFVQLAQDLGYGGSDEGGALSYLLAALDALSGGDAVGLLTDILLYHVVGESLDSTELGGLAEVATLLDGATVGIDGSTLVDKEPDLADPTLVATDIEASNGIVHAIDRVLVPADLPDDGFDFIFVGDQAGAVRGTLDDDVIVGTTGNDRIQGDRGDDVVFLGDGHDFVQGGRGADVVYGGDGNDRIKLDGGSDEADGGAGNDRIFGGRGHDQISGGEGDDRLEGHWGADVIEGGAGDDHMWGGPGPDTFVFADGFGTDVIHDFQAFLNDTLDFSGHSGVSGIEDLTVEQTRGGTLVSDMDGNSVMLLGVRADAIDSDVFTFG